jgi:glycosyltransferase involved in cell wall biosynthesis
MSRPALAYVVNSLNPGGTEKLVVDMSLAFSADFEVVVICLDEPGLWADKLRTKNIPVYCLWRQPGLDFAVALKLARFCRQWRIDIIHAHQCTPWFYAALARLIYSSPRLLFEEHGRFYPEVKKKKRILVNKILISKLTHSFVAVSEDIRRRLVKYEGLNYGKIEVIYNGVEPEAAVTVAERLELRREMGTGVDDFVVGTVGRLDPIKNLPLLVKSISCARKKHPNIRGLLVGDGPALGEIKALIDNAGLNGVIALPGYRTDARKLTQCMDLFALSSFSEGTSMALLEAMTAGTPVVVTAVGGNPEIVVAGETGWVVESDCKDELVAAILEASAHPAKTSRFGEAGRCRFQEMFTFDGMVRNYRTLYGYLAA